MLCGTFQSLNHLVDLLLKNKEFWIILRSHSYAFQVAKTVLQCVQHFRRGSFGHLKLAFLFSARFVKPATMTIRASRCQFWILHFHSLIEEHLLAPRTNGTRNRYPALSKRREHRQFRQNYSDLSSPAFRPEARFSVLGRGCSLLRCLVAKLPPVSEPCSSSIAQETRRLLAARRKGCVKTLSP